MTRARDIITVRLIVAAAGASSMTDPTGLAARSEQYERPVKDCSDILRYCCDPEYRAAMDAERVRVVAGINAEFDAMLTASRQRRISNMTGDSK